MITLVVMVMLTLLMSAGVVYLMGMGMLAYDAIAKWVTR